MMPFYQKNKLALALHTAIFSGFWLISPVSFANDVPTATLDTIVITATRTEKGVKEAPIPVSVIGKKQLEQHQARTLKQALELLPQIQLRQLHGKTGYEVVMQGFEGNQVLILIDGLPITPSTGSTVNLNQYLNVDVEQIEVIQGASSAQYGSSAMGGVVNVITKRLQPNEQRFSGHISADIGSNGKQNPSGKSFDDNYRFFEASGDIQLDKQGEWLARVSASHLDDKGLSVDTDKWDRLKDNAEQSQLTAKLQYAPLSAKNLKNMWFEVGNYDEKDISRFSTFKAPATYLNLREENIDKQRFSAGFSHQFNQLNNAFKGTKLTGSTFYENYDSTSETSVAGITTVKRQAEITTKLAQFQLDFPAINHQQTSHLLQVGLNHQKDSLNQTNNGNNELNGDNVSRDVNELYVQDDWLIGENWEVVAGARYQNDSDFGSHIAPKISAKYNHLGKAGIRHIWRASVGGGYRVPNLKERYYLFDHSNLGYKVMGNPNLVPETSTSYQIGYQSDLTDNLSLALNLFYNDVKDLIQTDRTQPIRYENNGSVAIYQYNNVDKATMYGGDMALTWQALSNLDLQLNYGYLHTHNKTTDSELTKRPKHKAGLIANYHISPKLQWINSLNYEDKHLIDTANKAYSPAWWTWNTRLNYQANQDVKLYMAINNLLDKQRDTTDNNDQSNVDNRQWLIGASYQF